MLKGSIFSTARGLIVRRQVHVARGRPSSERTAQHWTSPAARLYSSVPMSACAAVEKASQPSSSSYKVSGATQVKDLAGSIAKLLRSREDMQLFCIGLRATNTSVKALATARYFLEEGGAEFDLEARPFSRCVAVRYTAYSLWVRRCPQRKRRRKHTTRVGATSDTQTMGNVIAAGVNQHGETLIKVAGPAAVCTAIEALCLAERGTLKKLLYLWIQPGFEVLTSEYGGSRTLLDIWVNGLEREKEVSVQRPALCRHSSFLQRTPDG